jgi:hypothetical protein
VFGLTSDDVRADDDYALKLAIEKGSADVAQWLCVAYGIKCQPVYCRRWTRASHHGWYWQPHAAMLATELSPDMLGDVLRMLSGGVLSVWPVYNS